MSEAEDAAGPLLHKSDRDALPRETGLVRQDPWQMLRSHTPARIALGRVGASLPTTEVLAFSMAHARARDAVHLGLDTGALAESLKREGFAALEVRSRAGGRAEYLRRPDLGRRLHPECRHALMRDGMQEPCGRLTVVIADGLSALAAQRHALPLLCALRERVQQERAGVWELDSVVIATEARVALGDEVGQLRGAEAVVMLLGERPGMSAPDSLGIYLTYAPRIGRTDAERNCISNVRREGMSYAEAAYKLHYLLTRARAANRSGIGIKDQSEWEPPVGGLPVP